MDFPTQQIYSRRCRHRGRGANASGSRRRLCLPRSDFRNVPRTGETGAGMRAYAGRAGIGPEAQGAPAEANRL